MNWFIILWVVVGIVIAMGGTFWAGFSDEGYWEKDQTIASSLFIAVMWPFFLAFAIIVAPFAIIYYLGKCLKEKK